MTASTTGFERTTETDMVTNDERREVARRLRELPDDSTYPDLIGAIADHDGWYAAADAADRLADLIEPSEGQNEPDVSVDRGLGTEGGRSPDTGGQCPKSCPKMSGVSGIECDGARYR